jgi:hypothetical protein
MNDQQLKPINQLEDEFKMAVKNTLDLPIKPGASQHGSDFSWHKFKFRIPNQMKELKDTRYYCKESHLLHFTSLEALYSIINESSIRMYNLLNSKDTKEYQYAGEIFKYLPRKDYSDDFKTTKKESFISSFTKKDNIASSFHWKEYGRNYKGVAIEFEVNQNCELWKDFILSNVIYGNLSDFAMLRESWMKIQKASINCQYTIEMDWLLSLYKKKLKRFVKEEEIRLFRIPVFNTFLESSIYSSIKSSSPELEIKYLKLPLCDRNWNLHNDKIEYNQEEQWKSVPKLRIARIYIGPDLHFDNWGKFESVLRHYINEKTGWRLEFGDIQRISKNVLR